MSKIQRPATTALYPVPAALISCADQAGRSNIITLAWVGTVCSEPPMLSISVRPHRFSSPIIERAGEFVVNLPSQDLVLATDLCGIVSGRAVDKWEKAKLTPHPAVHVKAPLIQECPVNIECRVRQTIPLGSHDCFISEILAVHADEEALTPRGELDPAKLAPIAYVAGQYWSLGARIGFHGFAHQL